MKNKKDSRKQVLFRLPETKYDKLKRFAITQAMVSGKPVTVQNVLEKLVDGLITPAALLPTYETEKVEEL